MTMFKVIESVSYKDHEPAGNFYYLIQAWHTDRVIPKPPKSWRKQHPCYLTFPSFAGHHTSFIIFKCKDTKQELVILTDSQDFLAHKARAESLSH